MAPELGEDDIPLRVHIISDVPTCYRRSSQSGCGPFTNQDALAPRHAHQAYSWWSRPDEETEAQREDVTRSTAPISKLQSLSSAYGQHSAPRCVVGQDAHRMPAVPQNQGALRADWSPWTAAATVGSLGKFWEEPCVGQYIQVCQSAHQTEQKRIVPSVDKTVLPDFKGPRLWRESPPGCRGRWKRRPSPSYQPAQPRPVTPADFSLNPRLFSTQPPPSTSPSPKHTQGPIPV
ncbi:uncharacterized protein WM277_004007 [Molossus nigricans]